MKYRQIGPFVVSYCGDSSWAQWEKAGMSIRLGRHLFALHREDYRDSRPGWPKWLRFNVCFRRPA